MKKTARVVMAALLLAGVASVASGQGQAITAAERSAAVEGVARQMESLYVVAEIGRQMAGTLRQRAAGGEYEAISEGPRLAELLTSQLREISNDLHVFVHFSPAVLPPEPEGPPLPTPEQLAQLGRDLARQNYGVRRLEILPGNIGYLKLDLFAPPEFAGDTYASMMGFVAETDALIIDLRENGGSLSPDAIPMVATYFFERATHLIDLQWGFEEQPRQLWTWGHVPGRRYLDKPVYLLTSGRTFSGAEEFAYDLKNLGRAKVVGETTGGGANGGGTRRASDHFAVFVPFGRVTSPITGTNWEGVGVSPDIEVPANKALLTAQLEAIRGLKSRTTDDRQRQELDAAEAAANARLGLFERVTFELRGHDTAREAWLAGSFNGWSPKSNRLTRQNGRWRTEVELEPGRYPYKFIVDGAWILDPANRETERDGEHVNSVRSIR